MRLKYLLLPWFLPMLIWAYPLLGRDSLRVDTMLVRVKELNKNAPKEGLKLLQQLEQESIESKNRDALFRVRINISNWEGSYGSPDSSRQILLRLEAETSSDSLYPMRGSVLHNLGKYHQDRGEYSKALQYFLKAQKLFEQTDQIKGLASVLGKLAFIYKAQGQLDRAKEYYQMTCDKFKELGSKKEYAITLHNFGFLYVAEENFPKAESLFTEVVQFATQNQLPEEIGLGQFALAGILSEQGKLKEAEAMFLQVRETDFIRTRPDRLAGYLIRFGTLKYRQNKPAEALKYCTEANQMAQQLQSLELLKSACLCLADAHEASGNATQALNYFKQYYEYRDSLEQQETQAMLAGIRAEYDFEKVEKELAQTTLEKEREQNLRQEAENLASDQRKKRIFFLMLALLAIGFLGYFLFANRNIQRKNKVIESALAEKEVLLGEVHHRVKNNLQLIVSIIDLQARSTEHAPTETLLEELRNRIHAITVLHQQLYQQPELHAIRTKDYLPPILENLRQTVSPHAEMEFTYEIEDFSMPVGMAISLGLIVSELVTNSFRHGFKGKPEQGKVWFILKKEGESIQLEVGDNGQGMQESKENFGMRMVRSLTRQMKAELKIVVEQGTRTQLTWSKEK